MADGSPSRAGVIAGFLAVYLIWGSTYLAIRVAVETLPPFLMSAVRFAVAGTALVVWRRARGVMPATARQWAVATIAGNLLLLGGTGVVSWAEQWVPSGLAALLIASVPLWMGMMNWLVEPLARPRARGISGILVGFTGVGLLVDPSGGLVVGRPMLVGALAILGASMLWAAGSLYSRHADRPKDPLLVTGMQMLGGGAGLIVTATIAGEWSRLDPAMLTAPALGALGYLIVFGSIVAFSAYVWLLQVATPAKVATYAYVNPVVAVILGWAILGEPLTARTFVAAAVIVTAVILITTERVAASTRG